MDRISRLPESIVHNILSYFGTFDSPPVELVRMSVVSKTWFHLIASFPILDFHFEDFTSRESFFKYVEYTTSRFCHHNLTAVRFLLIATIREPAESDIVNRYLQLLLRNGVTELVIDANNSSNALFRYRLPDILLSVSMLTSLEISSCELPSSMMLDAVNFRSLIELKLRNVPIDDEVIKYLTTSCPILQKIYINSCCCLKNFCVYGHQHLRKVTIYYDTLVEKVDIEAPNLSTLFIADYRARGAPRMNLASCKKLTTVIYTGHPSPNSNGFNNFLSNFPFIKNLYLGTEYKCKSLKLSSHSLRKLVLLSVCDLDEIELSTPNLVLFGYPCNYSSFWDFKPVVKQSTHLKACMQCYPDGDTLWFQKLRRFLDKKNGFKVLNLCIHAIYSQRFTELERLKAIALPPYELQHVELQLESHDESLAHMAFVDAVLWCCRPRSLTLRSSFPLTDFEEQSDIVKFTYEKLLQQEDQGHTNIQIVSPSPSFLMALSGEGQAISFVKKKSSKK